MFNLKKIFSFEKSDFGIIIYFLGIKIKFSGTKSKGFKKRNKFLFDFVNDYILFNWYEKGATESLLTILNFLYRSNGNREWVLILICLLLEKGKKEEALQKLNTYIHMYGYFRISELLPVANLAHENGCTDQEIQKSSKLFIEFKKNKDAFKGLVTNKKVAIVGNSPCEKGKNKGQEIDAHDVVVRFNRIDKISGLEKDYGSKTTIWVRNIEVQQNVYDNLLQDEKLSQNVDLICLKIDYWHSFVNSNVILRNIQNAKRYCACYLLEERNIISKLIGMDFHNSTVGFHFSLLTSQYVDMKDIDLYGFSFLEGERYEGHIYNVYNNEEMHANQAQHDVNFEMQFLKMFFSKKNNEMSIIRRKYEKTSNYRRDRM